MEVGTDTTYADVKEISSVRHKLKNFAEKHNRPDLLDSEEYKSINEKYHSSLRTYFDKMKMDMSKMTTEGVIENTIKKEEMMKSEVNQEVKDSVLIKNILAGGIGILAAAATPGLRSDLMETLKDGLSGNGAGTTEVAPTDSTDKPEVALPDSASQMWDTPSDSTAKPEVALPDSTATQDPNTCLLYTSPSPRDRTRSRMPSSA